VDDSGELTEDLRCIERLIQIGHPLTPESRLIPGNRVRVASGLFAGFEGIVLRRERQTRLLVYVNFMRQGASVLLEDCLLHVL
jgi:transcriptional antiterminator RfaH